MKKAKELNRDMPGFEIRAFMFGIDDDLDMAIINYLKKGVNSQGVPYERLILHFIHDMEICGEKRLERHLLSLIKFEIIDRVVYPNYIIYKINKKMDEEQKKNGKRARIQTTKENNQIHKVSGHQEVA